MKTPLFTLALIAITFMACDKLNSVSSKKAPETPKEKHSYAIGTDMARNIKQIDPSLIDYKMMLRAISDQLERETSLMNDSEVTAALRDFMQEMSKQQFAKDSAQSAENLVKQKEFFAKNKSEPGIVSTESGLQYIVLTEGKGDTVKDGDTVSVHYTGTFLDGKEFDSSIKRNQPLTIPISRGIIIPGWEEMLRLMNAGEKVRVWIPSDLGYGANGQPPVIPGNAAIVFEMELLEILPKK